LRLYLFETLTGVYALEDEYHIYASQTWPNDANTIAKILRRIREGDTSVMDGLLSQLRKLHGVKLVTSNPHLAESLRMEFDVDLFENIDAARALKSRAADLAVEGGFIPDPSEYGLFSHDVLDRIARMEVHDRLSHREALLIPAVQLLGDLDNVLNGMSNRMREWYGVHFPELGRKVREHTDYARVITRIGARENITAKALMELSFKKKDAEKIEEAAAKSLGADFDEVDLNIVRDYAQMVLSLYQFRERQIEYVSMITKELAPNLAYIAGPVLGAKLIEKAGGLSRLGTMPSSKIQVLGAEKALFRSVKTKAKPPKHGLLYQHPYVNKAPRGRRGNRARSLAAKIAIAARADLFTGNFIAEELVSQLEDY